MSQTRSTHALKGTFLQLPRAYFIPARHTVSVSMGTTEICAANYDPRKCYDSYFRDADALVIFDERARLKINIPMPQLIYEPKHVIKTDKGTYQVETEGQSGKN